MKGVARFLIALAALASGGAAPAQSELEGLYVAQMMETASALELMPEGRFRWVFSQGALDMTAEGRWRRAEDGSVLLDTQPMVRPPEVVLLGSGREGLHPELIVRITGPDGQAAPDYLRVEGEYESGELERASHTHREDSWNFPAVGGRPERIVAIRITFPALDFRSERFEVPAGANAMRFSFAPNGLGRGDFRGERVSVAGDSLTLTLLGQPIRYRRATGEERAAQEGMMDDIATEAGAAPQPGAPIDGPVDITIGAPLDPRLARALTEHRGWLLGDGPVALRLRLAERTIDFGRVGGPGLLMFGIDPGAGGEVQSLLFSHQDRMLALAEGIERGQALQRLLLDAGFADRPAAAPWPSAFEATERAGDPARRTAAIRAADWASARRLLESADPGVVSMHLFTLRSGGVQASASLENVRLISARDRADIELDEASGREWLLTVTIERDAEIMRRGLPPDE